MINKHAETKNVDKDTGCKCLPFIYSIYCAFIGKFSSLIFNKCLCVFEYLRLNKH